MPETDPKAPVTKEVLDSALEHVIETVRGMIEELGKKLTERMDKGFSKAAAERQALEAKVAENSRKIDDLKQDLALTSERKETEDLKRRVQRLEGFHAH